MSNELTELKARFDRLNLLYQVGDVIHSTLEPREALQLGRRQFWPHGRRRPPSDAPSLRDLHRLHRQRRSTSVRQRWRRIRADQPIRRLLFHPDPSRPLRRR